MNRQFMNLAGLFSSSAIAIYATKSIFDNKNKIEESNLLEISKKKDDIKEVIVYNNNLALVKLYNSEKIYSINIPKSKNIEKLVDLSTVPIIYKNTMPISQILSTGLSLSFLGIFAYLMYRQSSQFNFSQSKNFKVSKTNVKFNDIIGQNNARKNIKEFVDILLNNEKFKNIGVNVPKGALLYGPPGTGKTLLAKAVATESNLPFINMTGSDFNAMFVGVGASKIRSLYEEARKVAKTEGGCIIFIDEIDAIGQKRNNDKGFGGNSERENTLNQLLTEMDGFESSENILTFAATNRPELLDSALLRPGRFDRKIVVELPMKQDREELFKYYLSKLNFKFNENNEKLDLLCNTCSKLTSGFSGADISNICNESGILAVRNNRNVVNEDDIKKSIDFVMMGNEKGTKLTDYEKEIVAYHEAGHAYLSYILENANKPIKVSIIPREKGMLGFSQSYQSESEYLQTKKQIEDNLSVLMGGRIAEQIFCGDISNGASNDIEKATSLAKTYVEKFSMCQNNFRNLEENSQFKNNLGMEMLNIKDQQINELLSSIYYKTHDLLDNNQSKIIELKDLLLEKETIYEKDIDLILA